jgi:hypothetical protein
MKAAAILVIVAAAVTAIFGAGTANSSTSVIKSRAAAIEAATAQ